MADKPFKKIDIILIVACVLFASIGLYLILGGYHFDENWKLMKVARVSNESSTPDKFAVLDMPDGVKQGSKLKDDVVTPTDDKAMSDDMSALKQTNQSTKRPTVSDSGGGRLVAIDAGHQLRGNSVQEPVGPGASQTKAKVTSGTRGVSTRVPEYQLNLDISLKLRDELTARGYKVYMVRETNEVNLSNKQRAEMARDAGADILVRIHANGSENSNESGTLTISPTAKNPYVRHLYKDSRSLSGNILSELTKVTKSINKGVWETDTMSGINWSSIPVTIVEMGFMSNAAEDRLMQTAEYQEKLVTGIANGVDSYYADRD